MVGALMSYGAAALSERTNWRRAQTIFSTELSLLRRWILSGDRRDGETADRDALITALRATPMSIQVWSPSRVLAPTKSLRGDIEDGLALCDDDALTARDVFSVDGRGGARDPIF
jgi:hypothetical protein